MKNLNALGSVHDFSYLCQITLYHISSIANQTSTAHSDPAALAEWSDWDLHCSLANQTDFASFRMHLNLIVLLSNSFFPRTCLINTFVEQVRLFPSGRMGSWWRCTDVDAT